MTLTLLGLVSVNPVILIPGSMRSRLLVKTNRNPTTFCKPEELHLGWIRFKDFLPHRLRCLTEALDVDLDQDGRPSSVANVSVIPDDFGGLSGVIGTGSSIFGRQTLIYYGKLVNKLIEVGLQPSRSLRSAPFDWRFGIDQPKEYYDSLKSLVEETYNNTGMKVNLVGHSLGGALCNRFLTTQTTPEWRKKYIESQTLVAPSWSGSGMAFLMFWLPETPFYPESFFKNLGVVHIHFPNTKIYSNMTVLIDPDGTEVKGIDLLSHIKNESLMGEKQWTLAKENFVAINEFPAEPDVRTNILYNGGMKTPIGVRLLTWSFPRSIIYTRGDKLVGVEAIEWACKNWKIKEGLNCMDVNSTRSRHKHKGLLTARDTLAILLKWLGGSAPPSLRGDDL